MKFKFLIIAFFIITVIVIIFTVLLPKLLENPEITMVSVRGFIVPFTVLMGLILAAVCTFFFLNYRLLSLLEREDWPALAYYLEQRVFGKKRYTSRYVRLLASSYLVISDFASVIKLEGKTALAKPSLVTKFALIFGSARILSGNHGQAAAFFKTQMERCKAKDLQWIRWFHGFSHLLGGAFNSVEPDFSFLAVSSNNALITGLSAYFLHHSIEKYSFKPEECRKTSETGRQRVKNAIKTIGDWTKEADKYGTDIHIAIIRKYITEAGIWIYGIDEKEPVKETAEIIKVESMTEESDEKDNA